MSDPRQPGDPGKKLQSKGRDANDAEPLGEKSGLISKEGVERTGRKARTSAGPDGPDASAVGETFKKPPR